MERQRDPRLAPDLLLAVGIDEEREGRPVGARRGLHDEGHEVLVGVRVEVLQVLARRPLVVAQVEVAPVVDALQLLPAEREAVLDVDGLLGVVRQLVRRVLPEAQPLGVRAQAHVPVPAPRQPLLEDARGLVRAHEVLHLHLLELAHPEHEVAGADLVPEALADLGDAKGQLPAHRLLDVLEVDVRALGGLGSQVDDRGVVLDGAHVRLEHEVEAARRRQRPAVVGALDAEPLHDVRVLELGLATVAGARQLIQAISTLAGGALDQRVAERRRRGPT